MAAASPAFILVRFDKSTWMVEQEEPEEVNRPCLLSYELEAHGAGIRYLSSKAMRRITNTTRCQRTLRGAIGSSAWNKHGLDAAQAPSHIDTQNNIPSMASEVELQSAPRLGNIGSHTGPEGREKLQQTAEKPGLRTARPPGQHAQLCGSEVVTGVVGEIWRKGRVVLQAFPTISTAGTCP